MTGNPLRSPLLALVALACAEAEPEDESTPFSTWETSVPGPTWPDCEGPLEFEPGTGRFAFEPLMPGGSLTIIQRPDGGWDTFIAARVHAPPGMILVSELLLVTPEHPLGGEDHMPFAAELDAVACVGDIYGLPITFDDYAPPDQTYRDFICGLEGQPATLSYTLEDYETGEAASVSIEVTLAVDLETNDCS